MNKERIYIQTELEYEKDIDEALSKSNVKNKEEVNSNEVNEFLKHFGIGSMNKEDGRILIVGLGNPEYDRQANRHNIGYITLSKLAFECDLFDEKYPEYKSRLAFGENMIMCKPICGMNESGEAVKLVMDKFDISDVIVIHDEMEIPFNHLRIKRGGKPGGHNGLKSIDKFIGDDYIRFRIGIGRPTDGTPILDYVLGDFQEYPINAMNKTIEGIRMLVNGEPLDKVQNKCVINKD